MYGVVNELPDAIGNPPDGELYQLIGKDDEADSINVPGPHLDTSETMGEGGIDLMMTCTGTLLLGHSYPVEA